MNVFVKFLLIGLISNNSHVPIIYLKYNYINKCYNFNIKLNYNLKHEKTKQALHLLW
jgi:hypothetical protein